MPESLGTRTKANQENIHPDQGSETRTHTRDLGMAKRVVAVLTFVAGTARVTGANGTFTNTFKAGDPILVEGTNLNNGWFEVLALDAANAAFLSLDRPPKDEGPVTCVIRTA